MISLAFLICGEFWNLNVWTQWIRDAQTQDVIEGVVVHFSPDSKKSIGENDTNFSSVVNWIQILNEKNIKASMIPSVPTSHRLPSLMKAELLLFDECLSLFNNSTHFLLLSEKTIPLLNPQEVLLAVLRTKDKSASEIYPTFTPEFAHTLLNNYAIHFEAGSQFILLHAKQDNEIREKAHKVLQECWSSCDWIKENINFDEFLLHSLLHPVNSPIIYCEFAPGSMQSKEFSEEWCIQNLPRFIRQNRRSSIQCLGMRKVRCTESVQSILEKYFILESNKK